MSGTYGTENIVTVIEFGTDFGDAIKNALADDGKISGLEFIPILRKAAPLIGIVKNIKETLKEFADLDETDKANIQAHFEAKFDLPNDELEIKIEKGFNLALNLVDYIVEM